MTTITQQRVLGLALDSLNRKVESRRLSPTCVKLMAELLRLSIEANCAVVPVERKQLAKVIGVSLTTLDKSLAILERWELIEDSFQGNGYRIRIYPWEGPW